MILCILVSKKVHDMLRTYPAQGSTVKDRDDAGSYFKNCTHSKTFTASFLGNYDFLGKCIDRIGTTSPHTATVRVDAVKKGGGMNRLKSAMSYGIFTKSTGVICHRTLKRRPQQTCRPEDVGSFSATICES